MNNRLVRAALCIFLITIGLASAQIHSTEGQVPIRIIAPIPPAMKERMDEQFKLYRAAVAAVDAGNYVTAEADARQSIALGGGGAGFSEALLPEILSLEGKTQEAHDQYKKLVEVEGSRRVGDLLPYSLLELQSGHWENAADAYNEAMPQLGGWVFIHGHSLLADRYFSRDNPQPRNLAVALHLALGLSYGSGEYIAMHSPKERALSEYKQAVSLEPNSALAHLCYAHGLKEVGRKSEAFPIFKKIANSTSGDMKEVAADALR